jgi:prepilin-type N-terminal cleavage/methylation domain-containing protein
MLKAFTLIEILVVIIIIGILGTMTMNFSRDSIDDATARNEKERFLFRYNSKLSQNLTTKRHNQQEYLWMTINLKSGDNFITNTILFKNNTKESEIYNLQKLHIQGNKRITRQMNINIQPYTFDCNIDNWEKEEKQDLTWILKLQLPRSSVLYCFSIQPHTCKLKEIWCEWLSSK